MTSFIYYVHCNGHYKLTPMYSTCSRNMENELLLKLSVRHPERNKFEFGLSQFQTGSLRSFSLMPVERACIQLFNFSTVISFETNVA